MENQSENIPQELKGVGEKLAILLAASDFPREVKDSWAALIPEMSLEQIDRLMHILEQHISKIAPTNFSNISTEVQKFKDEHATSIKDSSNRAMQSMQYIEEQISKSE